MAKAEAMPLPDGGSDWVERGARVGYVAKGAVYAMVGLLATMTALGFAGGRVTDTRGAIAGLRDEPFGQLMLALLTVGLGCFVVWRLIQAIKDPERKGTDAKGLVQRAALLVSGVVHAGLALYTLQLLLGGGGGGGDNTQESAGWLMGHPFGVWLVGIVGIVIVAAGIVQLRRAVKGSYRRQWQVAEMSALERQWASRVSALGIAARGIALGLIGWFFINAAVTADPSEARGLEGALGALASSEHGWLWLGAVGLGFVCYGAYCFVNGRYKRIRT